LHYPSHGGNNQRSSGDEVSPVGSKLAIPTAGIFPSIIPKSR